MRRAALPALVAVLALGACFVSEGDCVQNGIVVQPCAINARAGQTVVLRAAVVGAPEEPIDWILPASAGAAFAVSTTDNSITLISLQNVSASYPIQASSRTEDSVYGGSVVGVGSATFGSQPPPFVLFGGDLPVGSKAGATAAGGNLYYVAYASSELFVGGSPNFFVKQYDLATNALLADIPGQFSLFDGTGASPIFPNVEADCQGNGYWVDRLNDQNQTIVLRRLAPGATTPDQQVLGDNTTIASFVLPSLSVSCTGRIYFLMEPQGQSLPLLFRIDAFGSTPFEVITPSFSFQSTPAMAIDGLGRLLFADNSGEGPPVNRWLVTEEPFPAANPDPSFVPTTVARTDHVTVDGAGVIYYVLNAQEIVAMNELGGDVYSIDRYDLYCPEGCTEVLCDTPIPFTRIVSIDAAPNGALRVIDDPDTSTLPAACGESLRFVLIDPR